MGFFSVLKTKRFETCNFKFLGFIILLIQVSSDAILWPLHCFTSRKIVTRKKDFLQKQFFFEVEKLSAEISLNSSQKNSFVQVNNKTMKWCDEQK